MTLFIFLLIIWLVIILIAVFPHHLALVDYVFLYLANTILVVTVFTTLMLDMKYLAESTDVEKSLTFMLYRLTGIPLLLILFCNLWLSPVKQAYKWFGAVAIFATLNLVQLLLKGLGMVRYVRWDITHSLVMYALFMAFSSLIAWLFVRAERREVRHL